MIDTQCHFGFFLLATRALRRTAMSVALNALFLYIYTACRIYLAHYQYCHMFSFSKHLAPTHHWAASAETFLLHAFFPRIILDHCSTRLIPRITSSYHTTNVLESLDLQSDQFGLGILSCERHQRGVVNMPAFGIVCFSVSGSYFLVGLFLSCHVARLVSLF